MMKLKLALPVLGIVAAMLIQPACAKSAPAKTNDQIVAEQKAAYPLDTCVVMGEKLGAHGDAVDHVYNERLVRLCCKGCIPTFEKDAQTYLSKIDEAAKEKTKPEAAAGAKTEGVKTDKTEAAPKPHEHAHHH